MFSASRSIISKLTLATLTRFNITSDSLPDIGDSSNMLELNCIFCGEKTLVIRHVDTMVWCLVCVSCGARGPIGACNHEAKNKYKVSNSDTDKDRELSEEILNDRC